MKNFVMIKMFYSRIKGVSVVLGIIMFLALFMLCAIQGFYDYGMRNINYLNDKIGDADIYMQFRSWMDNEKSVELIDKLCNTEGVSSVLYNVEVYMNDGDNSYKVCYCPPDVLSRFFECNIEVSEDTDSIDCLSTYSNVEKGQILNVIRDRTQLQYTLNVKETDKKNNNYINYNTSYSKDSTNIDELVFSQEALYVPVKSIKDIFINNYTCVCMNCYVFYNSELSEEQISDIRNSVSDNFTCDSMNIAVNNSKTKIAENIERRLYIQKIAIYIVGFACCVVTLLIITQKLKEYAIYYLCGCSKLKLVLICIFSISLLFFIPMLLNLLIIIFYDQYIIKFVNLGDVLYSKHQILITLGFIGVTTISSGLIEAIIIAKMSPVELYRRMTR